MNINAINAYNIMKSAGGISAKFHDSIRTNNNVIHVGAWTDKGSRYELLIRITSDCQLLGADIDNDRSVANVTLRHPFIGTQCAMVNIQSPLSLLEVCERDVEVSGNDIRIRLWYAPPPDTEPQPTLHKRTWFQKIFAKPRIKDETLLIELL